MKKRLITAMYLAALGLSSAALAADPIIKVTLLGTGVPLLDAQQLVANGRANAGLLVEAGSERMLFDCGQGVYSRLLQSGGPDDNPNIAVDKVFLSHLHSDHYGDLAALYAVGALYRRIPGSVAGNVPSTIPLKVWGPGPVRPSDEKSEIRPERVGIKRIMRLFSSAYNPDFYVRSLFKEPGNITILNKRPVDVSSKYIHELPPAPQKLVYDSNGVTVYAFRVNHDPVIPAYGFRVDYSGHSFVYSGDTKYDQNLVSNAQNVDVLVHEVYGARRESATEIYDYHTPPEDAAKVFNETHPKQAVFTHMVYSNSPQELVDRTRAAGYTGPLVAGEDLMVIKVNADSTVIIEEPQTTPSPL